MDPRHSMQPPPLAGTLGRYAAANSALAGDADRAALDRYLMQLAPLTGCDLVLVYERAADDAEVWVLAAQWGVPADDLTRFERVSSSDMNMDMGMSEALDPGRQGGDAAPPEASPHQGRFGALLQASGVRMHLAFPTPPDAAIAAQVLFCSRQWDRFHPEILAVFEATRFDLAHALAKRRRLSIDAAPTGSPDENTRRQFIAVLAHELRNPIAPIRSGLDLIATELLDPPRRQATLSMMQRQLDHLVRLIDDLLDTVRLKTGKLQVRREPVVLRDVVRSAVECIRPALFAKHLALKLADEASDIVLEVDPVRLSQAFVNVLSANVKQTPEGGVVSVAVTAALDRIHITFEDEAPSADRDTLSNVFELFPRTAPRHSDDGLGIGLALVRGLVELNDGTVSARPRERHVGACYVVSLPLPAAPLAPPAPVAAETLGSWASHRVLVVDDNLDAASTLGLLLELDGATIRLAHDGPNAVEEARQFQPEVILLDIGIPGFDGCEAARRIRAMNPPVRPLIIALTGWGAPADREATAASGFDLHLVKPITHDKLRAEVRHLMGGAS